MDPAALAVLSIEIENQIDASGDLRPLPGKDSALFSISRHQSGYLRFYRYDLPPSLRRQLERLGSEASLTDHKAVRRILSRHTACNTVFAGKGYHFRRRPAPAEYPDAVYREGCYVIVVDGAPVSWAWTSDSSEQAAELAVETLPRYQRRGYARQVASAWAAQILAEGKVAFYSHGLDNAASEALARSLGVVQYAVVTTYAVRADG